ncbi:hypothetical protein C8J57DRAFT_1611645 [Mycena rebaudengoi]|nr:hypothetical protein C8J57DRAFT_1611645 [Mycena rebaudengoi]
MAPSEKFLVTGGLTLVALAVPDVQQGRGTPFSSGSQPCRTSLWVLGDTEFEESPGASNTFAHRDGTLRQRMGSRGRSRADRRGKEHGREQHKRQGQKHDPKRHKKSTGKIRIRAVRDADTAKPVP